MANGEWEGEDGGRTLGVGQCVGGERERQRETKRKGEKNTWDVDRERKKRSPMWRWRRDTDEGAEVPSKGHICKGRAWSGSSLLS